jgi:hypothetical protein
MKAILSSRNLFIMGFILIAATNILVLGGVFLNRSGEPDSRVLLTERELPVYQWGWKENSGISLNLAWRVLDANDEADYFGPWGMPSWLDAAKLKALGFDIDRIAGRERHQDHYKAPIPKEVFIVLEYGGKPFDTALGRLEAAVEKQKASLAKQPDDAQKRRVINSAERRLNRERVAGSRLFAVDAGLDPHTLREAYPDRSRFIITRGIVTVGFRYRGKKKRIYGRIKKISIDRIHVPLKFKKQLQAILKSGLHRFHSDAPPRYTVELAYGSRREPWIVAVKALH